MAYRADDASIGFRWGLRMKTFFWVFSLSAACVFYLLPATATENNEPLAKGVQDNSFLIEEAYNQEPGVVQHIATLQRQNRDWFFKFTQEWPLGSQTHQFSYSAPYSWLQSEGQRVQGIGDIMLNYRYQALLESDTTPAFAPRLSLILPTGNREKGTGEGSVGYEIMLPFSKVVSDRVTLHANAGMTSFFDVDGHQPTSFRLGGSGIYAVTRDFNLMFETLAEWNESVNALREIEREFRLTISPGFRYAFNLDAGQLVMGVGAPIGFTKNATDYGVMLYLSFEHSFVSKTRTQSR